jgi:DNA polymerase III delta subunit
VGLLSYNYRRLLMAKEMMERGVDRTDVAKVLKMRWNDQEPFLAAARRADSTSLKRAITRLAETDLAIKTSVGGSGPKGARMQIELLVCELASN